MSPLSPLALPWGTFVLNRDTGHVFLLYAVGAFIAERLACDAAPRRLAIELFERYAIEPEPALTLIEGIGAQLLDPAPSIPTTPPASSPSLSPAHEPIVQHVARLADREGGTGGLRLRGAAAHLPDGWLLLIGPSVADAGEVAACFSAADRAIHIGPEVEVDLVEGDQGLLLRGAGAAKAAPIAQVWLVGRRRGGAGLTLARRHPRETTGPLLAAAAAPSPRAEWPRLFTALVALAHHASLFVTTLPHEASALRRAILEIHGNLQRYDGRR